MKKYIALVMAAALALSTLTGCGSKTTGSVTTDGSTSMEKVIGALGEAYQNDFSMSILKERTLKSSRGNIYDRNGNPLAYNELSNCITFEDNASYSTMHIKNLSVNSTLYQVIKIVEEQGGYIKVSSKNGEGSVFGIYLPKEQRIFR